MRKVRKPSNAHRALSRCLTAALAAVIAVGSMPLSVFSESIEPAPEQQSVAAEPGTEPVDGVDEAPAEIPAEVPAEVPAEEPSVDEPVADEPAAEPVEDGGETPDDGGDVSAQEEPEIDYHYQIDFQGDTLEYMKLWKNDEPEPADQNGTSHIHYKDSLSEGDIVHAKLNAKTEKTRTVCIVAKKDGQEFELSNLDMQLKGDYITFDFQLSGDILSFAESESGNYKKFHLYAKSMETKDCYTVNVKYNPEYCQDIRTNKNGSYFIVNDGGSSSKEIQFVLPFWELTDEHKLLVTPKYGYRLSRLHYQYEDQKWKQKDGTHGSNGIISNGTIRVYEEKIQYHANCSIDLTFESNYCCVRVRSPEKKGDQQPVEGRVTVDSDPEQHKDKQINWYQNVRIHVQCNEGYVLEHLYRNTSADKTTSEDIISELQQVTYGKEYYYDQAIETGDVYLWAEFRAVSAATEDDFSWNRDAAIIDDGNRVVFYNTVQPVFSTTNKAICVQYKADGEDDQRGDNSSKTVTLPAGKTIEDLHLQVLYAEAGIDTWHKYDFPEGFKIEVYDGPDLNIHLPRISDEAIEKGIKGFNKDTDVTIKAEIPENFPDVESVTYWFEVADYGSIEFKKDEDSETTTTGLTGNTLKVKVPIGTYDKKNVRVSAYVTDVNGVTSETVISDPLYLNDDTPYYHVVMQGARSADGTGKYYNTARKAYFYVENAPLNQQLASNFTIFRRDVGSTDDYTLLPKETVAQMVRWLPDSTEYSGVVEISFTEEGEYQWEIHYMSSTNVPCERAKDEDGHLVEDQGTDIYDFVIDTTKPTGGFIDTRGDSHFLDDVWDTITFHLFEKESFEIKIDGSDDGSGIQKIEYLKKLYTEDLDAYSDKPETFSDLQALYHTTPNDFMTYDPDDPVKVAPDEKAVVYARIVDNAGNVVYYSTDGMIAEDDMPEWINLKVKTGEGKYIQNSDVTFTLNVNELDPEADEQHAFSGIKQIKYKVIDKFNHEISNKELYQWSEADGKLKQSFEGEFTLAPFSAFEQYKLSKDFSEYTGPIDFNPAFNNDQLSIIISAEDNAGNHYETPAKKISIYTDPAEFEMLLMADDEHHSSVKLTDDSSKERSVMVTKSAAVYVKVKDRADAFDADAFTNALLGITESESIPLFTAEHITDADGNVLTESPEDLYSVSAWNTLEHDEKERLKHRGFYEDGEDFHYAKITFNYCGNYVWKNSPKYVNRAELETELTANATSFTIDSVAPVCRVTIGPSVWDDLLSMLTFGIFTENEFAVTAEAEDLTSVATMKYYLYDGTEALTAAQLDGIHDSQWHAYNKDQVIDLQAADQSSARYTVYFCVTDAAGNYRYVCTDGHIIDREKPGIAITFLGSNREEVPIPTLDGVPVFNREFLRGVPVRITVKETSLDHAAYSGLNLIEYWVEDNDGVKLIEPKNLFQWTYQRDAAAEGETDLNPNGGKMTDENGDTTTGNVPKFSDLKKEWSDIITLDVNTFNRSDLKLVVHTVDNAGLENTDAKPFDIDISSPQIQISYDNNQVTGGGQYFNEARTATITIKERSNHFDTQNLAMEITAVDINNNPVADAYQIVGWSEQPHAAGTSADQDTHSLRVNFKGDANYTLAVSFVDKVGNRNLEPTAAANTSAPWNFTVDTTAPTGTITVSTDEGRVETWNQLADILHFGIWSKTRIHVSGTSDDTTSPIAAVDFFRNTSSNAADATDALTAAQLQNVTGWNRFSELDLYPNTQCAVYLRLTDMAGNVSYLSTNGLIVDDMHPHEEFTAPNIQITPEQTESGIYNGDVRIALHVDDPLVGGTYSGLKNVSYRVLNMGAVTQDELIYSFTTPNPTQTELQRAFEAELTVRSELNNSNDVVVEVYAEDNAGNSTVNQISLRIDITAPEITVTYNNNNVTNDLFNAPRTATISITERNFDERYVHAIVNDAERGGLGWTVSGGTGNGDNTTWTASIPFTADGPYTFEIGCTDLASNRNGQVNYGNSVSPNSFTIDATKPVIQVNFVEGENPHNGQYFQKSRIAEISVDDLHFSDQSTRITILLDGKAVENKDAWTMAANSNKHVKRVTFDQEGSYTFSVSSTDLAGNTAEDQQHAFVVDTTDPSLTLKVNDSDRRGAYREDITALLEMSDRNYDPDQVSLTLNGQHVEVSKLKTEDTGTGFVIKGESGKAITWRGTLTDAETENGRGRSLTLENFPTGDEMKEFDDIYEFQMTATDKSGRTTEKTLVFSVNRFGSTYDISEVKDILGTYTRTPIDVKISEVNPDYLKDYSVTLFKNNETITLREGSDFELEKVGEDDQWHEYSYKIGKENFKDDGIYSITLHSVDRANNVNENTLDTKESEISFGIDQTPPKAALMNLEDDETYAEDSKEVLLRADDNLLLTSVAVYLDDMDQPYQQWGQAEIDEIHANASEDEQVFRFDIPGDTTHAHELKVVCKDAANNPTEISATNFYVTTDLFIRYYNNKGLFFGSIAGFVAAISGLIFMTYKKKHSDE